MPEELKRAKRKSTLVRVTYPADMTAKQARTILEAGTNYWLAKIAPETKSVRVVRR